MRWILVVGVAVVGVVLVVVIGGLLLPKEHTARSYATINAPPESVWRALTDVEAFPAWRSDVARVEMLAPSNGRSHGERSGSTAPSRSKRCWSIHRAG
jgi:hypothetical protein